MTVGVSETRSTTLGCWSSPEETLKVQRHCYATVRPSSEKMATRSWFRRYSPIWDLSLLRTLPMLKPGRSFGGRLSWLCRVRQFLLLYTVWWVLRLYKRKKARRNWHSNFLCTVGDIPPVASRRKTQLTNCKP